MAGFFIHTSNHLEELARVLATFLLEKKSIGVLEPEVVVVPSRGLERWLKLDLARVNGISANLEFPFPQAFLEGAVFAQLRRGLDAAAAANPFTVEVMTWKIQKAWPAKVSFLSMMKALSRWDQGKELLTQLFQVVVLMVIMGQHSL